jgi:hypothetical protein
MPMELGECPDVYRAIFVPNAAFGARNWCAAIRQIGWLLAENLRIMLIHRVFVRWHRKC